MKEEDNYLDINKNSWNAKVDVHLASEFYNHESFLAGKSSLNKIELKLLGDVKGKTVLHLQCHFGQDTISLARLGAKPTGVDFSEKAISAGKSIAAELNADACFICSDVYELPNRLNEKFDIIFTSYGTIGWLPDLKKWANVISHFLKPGGRFVFAEFHPVVWMFDYKFREIEFNYFNSGPIIEETIEGTYADRYANIESKKTVCWNHSISEVVTSLIDAGLRIDSMDEIDYSPYNCFDETVEFEPGKFRIKHLGNKIPMVYTITASK